MKTKMTTPTEREVLRAVANGRVRRSTYGDVYLRDGAAVPLP